MLLILYILLSILLVILMFILSKKYGVFVGVKGTFVGFLYIILNVSYLGVLNSKSKLHFLYDVFDLGSFIKYQEYIAYFTIVLIFIFLFMGIAFIIFKSDKKMPGM